MNDYKLYPENKFVGPLYNIFATKSHTHGEQKKPLKLIMTVGTY